MSSTSITERHRRPEHGVPRNLTSAQLLLAFLLVVPGACNVNAESRSALPEPNVDTVQLLSLWRGGGSDVDGDGVPDEDDNCVEHANPNQVDTNGDGFGNVCDPDLNNDGFVTNTADLGLLRLAFFSRPGDANWNPYADFNVDGVVNILDMGVMRSFFFGSPGPITNTFIDPAGGAWFDRTNWSRGVVPNITHAVRIDLEPNVVVEYSIGDTEVASVRTTSDLVLSGGRLSVRGTLQVNATFSVLSNGQLANAYVLPPLSNDPLMITGVASFDSVTLASDLVIENDASLRVENGLTLDNDGDAGGNDRQFGHRVRDLQLGKRRFWDW